MKTPKGTELPLRNLKGQDYLDVKYRILWFREEHPKFCIDTSFVSVTDTSALVRADIRDDKGALLSSAHKFETKAGFPDFHEKAETGAIGRALANLGFGTQFAQELDDGAEPNIVDAPAEPKVPNPVRVIGSATSSRRPSDSQLKRLFAISRQSGWADIEIKQFMEKSFKKASTKDLDMLEYDLLCDTMQAESFGTAYAKLQVKAPQATEEIPRWLTEAPMDFEREPGSGG